MPHCSDCPPSKANKPASEFHRNQTRSTGFNSRCKKCEAKRWRARAGRHRATTKIKATAKHHSEYKRLAELLRSKPMLFSELCDRLDMSPARTQALLDGARKAGLKFRVEHDHVGIAVDAPAEHVQRTGIEPTAGQRQSVAVISDIHFGSRYCLREQLKDFIEYAYALGIREVVVPGDVLDGNYVRHGLFELSHVGLDNQVRDALESLPRKRGLTYHAITGNHDMTFQEQNGVDVGSYVENAFRRAGRGDIHFYGNRGAFLQIRGAIIHLWHPMGGGSYARSYKLQKRVENYSSGEKPHILLAGHWHVYCHVYERGVHALACPTFQGGGSAFGKAIGGAPAIGGMILSWEMTAHGTMRNFAHEFRAYFEKEKPQQVSDDTAWFETA